MNCRKDYIDYNSVVENILNINSENQNITNKKSKTFSKRYKTSRFANKKFLSNQTQNCLLNSIDLEKYNINNYETKDDINYKFYHDNRQMQNNDINNQYISNYYESNNYYSNKMFYNFNNERQLSFRSINGNVTFESSNSKIDENIERDEEMYMFCVTKPCSNDVQEKSNIV